MCINKPDYDLKTKTFTKLQAIRENKKNETIDYFNRVRQQALNIIDDQAMLDFFYMHLKNSDRLPSDIDQKINRHYVMNYGSFYDILFVDKDGNIFYSIKRESDYKKNFFTGTLTTTKLSKLLRSKKTEQFVEYEFYSPSDEPAAFFTVPLVEEKKHIGWFVLQCSINTINTILTDRNDLGRTGEVYLVNQKNLMLSESRFLEDSTVLKLKVDTKAVRDALKNNTGETILPDYRKVNVYSSYEKFDVFGVSWIIIAEIDENEVITEYFMENRDYFVDEIKKFLSEAGHKEILHPGFVGKVRKVEMNEYGKTKNRILQTNGVSECTALSIMYPGKFAYLTHIPPTDDIYISDTFTQYFLGENRSDFLGSTIRRIKYYELYQYEIRNLQFVIISPQLHSLAGAVDRILENGLDLANIKFMHYPDARGANVHVDSRKSSAVVEWYNHNGSFFESSKDVSDLGAVLKKIIRYDS